MGGWELADAFDPKQRAAPTVKICLECKGVPDGDDPGAHFGHGTLCKKCGYYRAQEEKHGK